MMPFCDIDAFSGVVEGLLPESVTNRILDAAYELYAREYVRGPPLPALYKNPRFKQGPGAPELTAAEERWRVMTNLVSWFAGINRWDKVYKRHNGHLRNWGHIAKQAVFEARLKALDVIW